MITTEEYISRIGVLQRKVASAGLDLLVVWDKDSIFYLTGAVYDNLERPFFILVYANESPILVVPQLELEHMEKVPNITKILSYYEFPAKEGAGWKDVIDPLIRSFHNIGVEPSLPISLYHDLEMISKNLIVSHIIEEMRLVKSAAEVINWAFTGSYPPPSSSLLSQYLYCMTHCAVSPSSSMD